MAPHKAFHRRSYRRCYRCCCCYWCCCRCCLSCTRFLRHRFRSCRKHRNGVLGIRGSLGYGPGDWWTALLCETWLPPWPFQAPRPLLKPARSRLHRRRRRHRHRQLLARGTLSWWCPHCRRGGQGMNGGDGHQTQFALEGNLKAQRRADVGGMVYSSQ